MNTIGRIVPLISLLLAGCGGASSLTTQSETVVFENVTGEMRAACLGMSDAIIAGLITAAEATLELGFTKAEALNDGFAACARGCENAAECTLVCSSCAAAVVDEVWSNGAVDVIDTGGDGGSPLNAGIYNGTIECLHTLTDGSTQVSTQEWIALIGDSGIPTAGGDEITLGMVLAPPPNSASPPETVLNVTVSANGVVILTEFEDEVTVCVNTCQFSFNGVCDDGFTGAATSLCQEGSDCFDCGGIVYKTSGTKRSSYKVHTSTSIEYFLSATASISGSQDAETRECTGILDR